MDGAVPLLEAQATTMLHVHVPLPGPRWIRVLVLQPAGNLEDPLVGSFEPVFLGKPLPPAPSAPEFTDTIGRKGGKALTQDEEEEAHDQWRGEFARINADHEHTIDSRRMCYDALSYTWSAEDGNASLSHSMLLDQGRLQITRNLADGLRRLRSCTTSTQLWIDAVCINQSDPIERSAQVALMFDIYRLARNLNIWLGESAFADEDDIAWQWISYCHDARRALPHGKLSLPYEPLLVEASDALLTTKVQYSRPSRFFVPQSGTFARPARQMATVEPATHGSVPPIDTLACWLAADAERLPRFVAKVEVFLALFKRKYWSRRWIVQENFSRMPNSGTKTIHWGKYSTDPDTLHAAVHVVLSVLGAVGSQDREGALFDYNAIAPYLDIISSVEGIVSPDAIAGRGLLERVIEFHHLQCADPRDRLYSLLSLVHGHNLEADYTATFETVCIRFAESMVQIGDMRVLYHAGDNNNDPSIDIPSWVADLHGYYALRSPAAGLWTVPDTQYSVNVDKSLTLDLYWIGDIVEGSSRTPAIPLWRWDGDVRRNGVILGVTLHFETRRAPVPGMNDVLCMLELPPWGDSFLWLRGMQPDRNIYRLVVAGSADARKDYDYQLLSKFGEFLHSEMESVKKSKMSVTLV